MTELPSTVDIREVGPRDGLQIEAPISTDDKIRLIQALVATGVRRIEATAFVSPRAVPAMADAEQIAEYVLSIPGVEWSGLVASPNGAKRAIGSGLRTIEYVVSAADGHSQANARRSTQEALDAVAEVGRIVHDVGGRLEVIIATAWDCPFDGPTDPAADRVHRRAGRRAGRRPAVLRRHHRHHHPGAGLAAVRRGPGGHRRRTRRGPGAVGRALPQLPRHRHRQRVRRGAGRG